MLDTWTHHPCANFARNNSELCIHSIALFSQSGTMQTEMSIIWIRRIRWAERILGGPDSLIYVIWKPKREVIRNVAFKSICWHVEVADRLSMSRGALLQKNKSKNNEAKLNTNGAFPSLVFLLFNKILNWRQLQPTYLINAFNRRRLFAPTHQTSNWHRRLSTIMSFMQLLVSRHRSKNQPNKLFIA